MALDKREIDEKEVKMSEMVKVKGIKTVDVTFVNPPLYCREGEFEFEPVVESSIKLGADWVEFRLADTESDVRIPVINIIEVSISDFIQPK